MLVVTRDREIVRVGAETATVALKGSSNASVVEQALLDMTSPQAVRKLTQGD